MSEEKSGRSGWRKFWEIIQTLGAGAGLLALKVSIEEALSSAGKKAGEKAGKKIGEAFGLDSGSADKTTDDESMFEKALVKGNLKATQKKKVRVIITKLRKDNSALAKELVRWVYNTMVKFESKKKITTGPKDNKEEITHTDYSEGIEIVEELFKELISARNDQEIEDILLQRNIHVVEKKEAPFVKATKDFAKKSAKKAFDGEKNNRQDVNQITTNWRERAKAWRKSR